MNAAIVYSVLRQQRLAWSLALIVGLTLTLIAHAPALPVVAGCTLVVLSSLIRSLARAKSPAREDG